MLQMLRLHLNSETNVERNIEPDIKMNGKQRTCLRYSNCFLTRKIKDAIIMYIQVIIYIPNIIIYVTLSVCDINI